MIGFAISGCSGLENDEAHTGDDYDERICIIFFRHLSDTLL